MRSNNTNWTVPEVELALLELKKITIPEFEILASFEVPPNVVVLVMEAVHTVLGAEDVSWEACRDDLLQERTWVHGSLTASEEFSKLLANTAPVEKFRRDYPKPAKPKKHAVLVKKILEYTGQGKDPKEVTESIQKYICHPEFTPEHAASASRAARALCVWVQAVDMNFQEQRKKPPRHQLEHAIRKGQRSVAGVYNLQVTKLLPEICKQTGKQIASKEYDDLQASKNYIMRRIFTDKHKEARRAISNSDESSAPDAYERDVDLRASHETFRKRLEGRLKSRDLAKRPEPRLVSLCKFNDRAFQPEAAGLRSWERFHNIDPVNVSFLDAEPRPCTVERKIRRAEEMDSLYKSDILIKQLLKAIDTATPDPDTIKRLVSAGANLDYVDDKGRTIYDIIRDKKLFVSLHVLDRIVQERKGSTFLQNSEAPSPEKTKKRTQAIHLPVFELPRPRSFQQQHRTPMAVKTYRKEEAPEWEPKYHLTDPNEVLSDSDVEEEEEEEEIDPEERKRDNIRRFCNLFKPPLTPPSVGFAAGPLELPPAEDEVATQPSIAGDEEPEEEVHPPPDEQEDPSFFLTDGGRLSLATPEDTSEEGLCAASPQPAQASSLLRSPSQRSGSGSQGSRGGGEPLLAQFERLQRESVAKKRVLFNIYKGSTDRGGIDDPASTSAAHEYLRLCEQLGLLPRPLAFGRPDQRDLNLQGFGLYPRHAQALALSIRGLDSCTSLNLQENKLGEEGLAYLCKALTDNSCIVSLNLSFNGIRTSSQHISDLLAANTTLKHLNFEGNGIPDKHLAKIVTSVSDPDVRDSLNIAGNAAGKHTSMLLVKLVEGTMIRTLDLCWMGLGKKFVTALSEVLDKNLHLKVLKLAWNGICDESLIVLSRCFTEAASTGKMKLEHLDLAHNRVRERGAATLALTIERYGAKLPLQSITLDGNAIGDIGVRSCIASMSTCGLVWGLWNCSPEVRPSPELQLFEGDRLWRAYELDLSDPYEHLVAWKVHRLSCPSAVTPEGQTWVDARLDGAAMEQPESDWDPPETGTLTFAVAGPIRELSCKKVFESEDLSVLVPWEEDGLPDLLEGTARVFKGQNDGDGEDDGAGDQGEGARMRVVKFVKQDLFVAAYDYERQLSDPVGCVNQFVAERLSHDIKTGALLYVDRSRIEVTEVRPDRNEFSVTGLSESLQTALTEGHRRELEFRHSFLLLAPSRGDEPEAGEAAREAAEAEGGEEAGEAPADDGVRRVLYEARLPRLPVEGVHLERIMAMLVSFSRSIGEEAAMLFLRTLSKDFCFSVRQAERIGDTFLFVPAKRLLPLLLTPADATASLHKLNKKAMAVTALGKDFLSVHRPWVDHDTAQALDEHLVHQQHALNHRVDGETFVDMVGGRFKAVRRGEALPAEEGMVRSVIFGLVDDDQDDEPMGLLSKVVLTLGDKVFELAVIDHDHHRRTLRVGDAPLSIRGGVELGEMASVASFKVSTMTREDQPYEFEYAEFMASPDVSSTVKSRGAVASQPRT